jgi:hypothetical protein
MNFYSYFYKKLESEKVLIKLFQKFAEVVSSLWEVQITDKGFRTVVLNPLE